MRQFSLELFISSFFPGFLHKIENFNRLKILIVHLWSVISKFLFLTLDFNSWGPSVPWSRISPSQVENYDIRRQNCPLRPPESLAEKRFALLTLQRRLHDSPFLLGLWLIFKWGRTNMFLISIIIYVYVRALYGVGSMISNYIW